MMRGRLILLSCLLAGVAAAQDAPEHGHGMRHGGRGRGGLFISPCGRPYRARPGEPYPVAAWFAETDTDHDGFLEKAEFRAEAAAFFKVLDTNHDGVIDSAEVDAYEHDIAPEILRGRPSASLEARVFLAQFGGGGGHGGGRRGGAHAPASTTGEEGAELTGAAPYNLLAEPEPVAATDTNFDQKITLEEFLAAADRRFEALDVRGGGRIALADLPKTAAQSPPQAGGERFHRNS